jgi:hypothetical protein
MQSPVLISNANALFVLPFAQHLRRANSNSGVETDTFSQLIASSVIQLEPFW